MKIKNYKNFSLKIRKSILKIANSSQCSHIGSSLSIVDILTVLYLNFLKTKKNSFILSKGHACLGLYCVLKEMGFITEKTLNSFGKNDSILMSHASHKVPSIELSTGSLGHGLPVASGIALAVTGLKQEKLGRMYHSSPSRVILAAELVDKNNVDDTRLFENNNIQSLYNNLWCELF